MQLIHARTLVENVTSSFRTSIVVIPILVVLRLRSSRLLRHDDLVDLEDSAHGGSCELDGPVLGDVEVEDAALDCIARLRQLGHDVETGVLLALVVSCLKLRNEL